MFETTNGLRSSEMSMIRAAPTRGAVRRVDAAVGVVEYSSTSTR